MMKSLTNRIMNYAIIVPVMMFAGTALTSTMFLQTSANVESTNVEHMNIVDIDKYVQVNTTIENNTEKISISTISKSESLKKTSVINVPRPEPIPEGIIYPKPTNVPILRDYDINKDSNVDIWHARNPESYITPNDEWVKYVASQLYIDEDGRLRYKNRPIPSYLDIEGNILGWTDEPFLNNYITDNELFDYPPNADLWQNADYYLSHGMKGDCEDWSIAVVSMMLSGDISIKENGTYVRQIIPAKAVMGLSGKNLDTWVEYNVYGILHVSSTGKEFNPSIGEEQSITTFHPMREWDEFNPYYQFTDKYFSRHNDKLNE